MGSIPLSSTAAASTVIDAVGCLSDEPKPFFASSDVPCHTIRGLINNCANFTPAFKSTSVSTPTSAKVQALFPTSSPASVSTTTDSKLKDSGAPQRSVSQWYCEQ